MKIFKDLITGDEMFTDSSKYKVIDDCLIEVECKLVTRKHGEIALDGANPSAEEATEGTDEIVESGIDLVLNHSLCELGFSKGDYKKYLKTYTKDLLKKWQELEWSDEKIAEAKTKLTDAVTRTLKRLDNCQFFMGESNNPDGLIALLEYRDNPDGGQTPVMMFFKHGLEEEKV